MGGTRVRLGVCGGLCVGFLLLGVVSARAQETTSGGCVFDRVVYPEGSRRCQDGVLVECQDGAWDDIGECDHDTAPPPVAGGGDAPEAGGGHTDAEPDAEGR